MQISELARGIAAKFEQSRLVFWYHNEKEFNIVHAHQSLSRRQRHGQLRRSAGKREGYTG